MTAGLVAASVAENAAWCALVCRTHGIGTERAGGWTRTLRPPPPYYPDLITLDDAVTGPEVAEQLRDRPACSVKDSYACLDLADAGFRVLFEARWLACTEPDASAARVDAWRVVHDAAGFDAWVEAHGDADMLRPSLLDDDHTRLWVHDSRPAGFVAHRTSKVVAVSNSFGDLDPADLWRQMVTLARRGWGARGDRLTVVAYESTADLAAPRSAGMMPIGPLRVWLRES